MSDAEFETTAASPERRSGSERIRLDEALQQVEVDAQLRLQATILDQVEDAVVGVDVHARIRYWNHGASKVYGWSAEEAMGRH